MNLLMSDMQKYMTLTDCPYCHTTPATEMAKSPRVVRCNTCGLWRFSPRMNKEGQVAYLEKFNDGIETANQENPLNYWEGNLDEVQELKRNFREMVSDGTILDVGTGEGAFLATLQNAGAFRAIGLEPLEKLAQCGKSAGLDIHVGRFESDGMPPALMGTVFDIVCFRESVYYLPDLRQAFNLLRRILRPGGGLYLHCHVPTSIYYWKNRNYLSRYGPNVSGMPTVKALTNILIKEGYEILKAGYLRRNVLHTLGLPFANLRVGGIIDSALWPVVHRLGKADRAVIFARRL